MTTVAATGERRVDAGTWTDRLQTIVIDGKSYLQRTQIATFKRKNGQVGATTETINVFDPNTLAPISRRFTQHIASTGKNSIDETTFVGDALTTKSTSSGKTTVTTSRSKTRAFDFYGGVYALLWVALPLRPGFSATFPSYGETDAAKVTTVAYHVVGTETIADGAEGSVKTWRIECNSDIGPLTYWVSDKTPYIIRMVYKDRTTGTTWTLTRIAVS